jgi:hypothetical protein
MFKRPFVLNKGTLIAVHMAEFCSFGYPTSLQ